MSPLSEALTAAQRSALAALEKAYVAGKIEPDAMTEALAGVGISDPVDTAFLLAALDVLREWGVAAPNLTERVTEAKVEPASEKQWALIRRLCSEKGVPEPDTTLTKATASQVIDEIQKGTYDPAKHSVPF